MERNLTHWNFWNDFHLITQRNIWLITACPKSAETSSRAHGHRSTIRKPLLASATGDNLISVPILCSGVLVEDCIPVWLNGTDAAWDDFIEEGNNSFLGKVLEAQALC